MFRDIWRLTLIALALSVLASPALAKGKGVYVPGLFTEEVVLALDLPDTSTFRRSDGTFIDLGYLHKVWGEGRWVGYIGDSRSYLDLDEPSIALMMVMAGRTGLPAVPAKPGGLLAIELLSPLIAMLLILGLVYRYMTTRNSGRVSAYAEARLDRQFTSEKAFNSSKPVGTRAYVAAARHATAAPPPEVQPEPQMRQRQQHFGRRGAM